MSRPKDDFIFEQFGAPVIPGGKKTAIVHCKYCNSKILYQFLVGQDNTKTPQAFCLSHPLNLYALMPA
eukprot:187000-Ditylum_brightwellii.AAC.1